MCQCKGEWLSFFVYSGCLLRGNIQHVSGCTSPQSGRKNHYLSPLPTHISYIYWETLLCSLETEKQYNMIIIYVLTNSVKDTIIWIVYFMIFSVLKDI